MKEVEHRTCYRILLFPIGSHVLIGALLKILSVENGPEERVQLPTKWVSKDSLLRKKED